MRPCPTCARCRTLCGRVVLLADERAAPTCPRPNLQGPKTGGRSTGTYGSPSAWSIRWMRHRRIHANGGGHTETIVTEDEVAAQSFLDDGQRERIPQRIDTAGGGYRAVWAPRSASAPVASMRGPVGADSLLTTRWLLRVRPGGRTAVPGSARSHIFVCLCSVGGRVDGLEADDLVVTCVDEPEVEQTLAPDAHERTAELRVQPATCCPSLSKAWM